MIYRLALVLFGINLVMTGCSSSGISSHDGGQDLNSDVANQNDPGTEPNQTETELGNDPGGVDSLTDVSFDAGIENIIVPENDDLAD